MKTSTLTITLLATLSSVFGCKYTPPDPCKPGLLNSKLTPEQLEFCEECSNPFGCIEGSTGEDEPETETISCYGSTFVEEMGVWTEEICRVGSSWDLFAYDKEANTCTLRHPGYPCGGSWGGEFEDECLMCEPRKQDNNAVYGAAVATSNDGWELCGSAASNLNLASSITPGEMSSDWPTDIHCQYPEIVKPACPHGFVSIGDGSGNPYNETYTCRCPTGKDDSCQDGAVCEQGFIVNDEGHFQPTLCAWDDGSPNGIAPEGPTVYGLDAWADGIIVDGDRVTMTPSFFVKASNGAVFNDDQSFGLLGDLTQVGPDSLAAHLDLEVGDVFDVDPQRTIDALALGEVVDITVIHGDGSERMLTVSLDLD